jgi:hypothetical protein
MKLKCFPGILICVLVFAVSTFSQAKTEINDTAAAKMLLGKHMLSLQWISWDDFGTAEVKDSLGAYGIKGWQKGKGNDDLLTIEGHIISIDAKQFVMEGTIVTKISHINGGQPCGRQGDFTFKITGKRKYWRLQEMDNPCDEATDYVDIYFR